MWIAKGQVQGWAPHGQSVWGADTWQNICTTASPSRVHVDHIDGVEAALANWASTKCWHQGVGPTWGQATQKNLPIMQDAEDCPMHKISGQSWGHIAHGGKPGSVWQSGIGPMPKNQRARYALICVNTYSGAGQAFPYAQATQQTILRDLEVLNSMHGTLQESQSDNDTHFKGKVKKWAEEKGVAWFYPPRAAALIERTSGPKQQIKLLTVRSDWKHWKGRNLEEASHLLSQRGLLEGGSPMERLVNPPSLQEAGGHVWVQLLEVVGLTAEEIPGWPL
ncbi:uncharacterized protein LOC133371813 [Rhineura floridana]|uniref:uncharacterized protein LOC133371813 n=1 Tax=Rhineura floridana TaxID=261503 RepID=UPI002AC874ED|nr:uncharacterized protein LOC133371813 [Rhineura floridana]